MRDTGPSSQTDSGPPQPQSQGWPNRESDEAFLDETIEFWQPHYGDRTLTRADAREIAGNVAGFFGTLLECWAEAGGPTGGTTTTSESAGTISCAIPRPFTDGEGGST